MARPQIFLYAEYQVSVPFDQIDWAPINVEMKKFPGLISKTWLSGLNTHSVGGFYAFESKDAAQRYVDGLLSPFAAQIGGNLAVRLFDAEATRAASVGMDSPYFSRD